MFRRRWVEGDALELPFSDGYFDAITMGYGLRNVVDKERAMQEMFRVLKPGLIISIFLKKYMKLDDCDSDTLMFFVVVGFSGSRVSVLDFNKSTQPFTNLIQVVTYVYYN